VVVVGAGFGGLAAVRALARAPVDVTVIDRNNYHTFLALIYQVAAAELETTDIAYPIRSILRKMPAVSFLKAELQGIDLERRLVLTDEQTVPYDRLILATGSIPHVFGVEGAAEYTFPLTSLEHAVDLRNHILCCFERAVHEPDPEQRRQILTFVIVGGGPTGVEFAGVLGELIHGPFKRDYPALNFEDVHIILIEAVDSLLSFLPEKLGRYTADRLRKRSVDVRLKTMVDRVTPDGVHLRDGSFVASHTVVWTAGVQGDPRFPAWGLTTAANGRVVVGHTLQVPDHPEVYVIGDLAYLEQNGHAIPMVAPAAVQEAKLAAENIVHEIKGEALETFFYKSPGLMVTIGRNSGVANLRARPFPRGLAFTGFPAWFTWLAVHLMKLIGFRNRMLVMINWAWDYFLFERGVRLIMPGKRC
jgi:NADH dehydrogenase